MPAWEELGPPLSPHAHCSGDADAMRSRAGGGRPGFPSMRQIVMSVLLPVDMFLISFLFSCLHTAATVLISWPLLSYTKHAVASGHLHLPFAFLLALPHISSGLFPHFFQDSHQRPPHQKCLPITLHGRKTSVPLSPHLGLSVFFALSKT